MGEKGKGAKVEKGLYIYLSIRFLFSPHFASFGRLSVGLPLDDGIVRI